jgi:N-acetylmuramoyl-L-alanine amidase
MIVILDAGHGGSIDGVYQTRGKQSPERPDGTRLYEGVNNRKIVEDLKKELEWNGIPFIDVVNTQEDKGLSKRIREANKVDGDTLYLSIHSNAAGKNGEWSTARGFGTYIYKTAGRKSVERAEIMHKNLAEQLTQFTKDRGIRRRDFAVLRETKGSAILLELGFHSNLEESYLIESQTWRNEVVKAIINSIKQM